MGSTISLHRCIAFHEVNCALSVPFKVVKWSGTAVQGLGVIGLVRAWANSKNHVTLSTAQNSSWPAPM